jgi:hypothetical protein
MDCEIAVCGSKRGQNDELGHTVVSYILSACLLPNFNTLKKIDIF